MTAHGTRFPHGAGMCTAAAATVFLAGCDGSGRRSEVTVRDSATVTVVESSRPRWSNRGWIVSPEPMLDIGAAEGGVEYQFERIEGLVRLADGSFVVADGGAAELRFFDREGNFVSRSGRRGDGPGEYQRITSLGYGPGDSLWVYDFGLRRFSVLTSSGALVRTVSVGGTLSAVGAVGRMTDGSFVIREFWSAGVHDQSRSGLTREPAAVAVLSPAGRTLDTLGLFPGREVFIGTEDGRAVMSAPLFARQASAALSGDDLIVGDQTSHEVGVFTAAGAPRRIYRWSGGNLAITGRDVREAVEAELADRPEQDRAMLRAHFEAMSVPETRPAYGTIVVDDGGHLWLAEYTRYPRQPREWTVLDPSGLLLGPVTVPDRFRVFAIGVDWVLGVWRDPLDVEHVRVYRLVKYSG